jgi:membrane-bound lytic murein transglycosylase MltF
MRKDSPLLKTEINEFVKKNKKGTLQGNIIFKKYLKNTKYIENSLDTDSRKRFDETIVFFKKYGDQYDFDWLMLAALAFQESKIDQNRRSHAGAVGVMQVLPTTAKDKNINIADIEKIDPNIHAGTKYLRFMMDRYFDDPKIDRLNRGLLAFASYNAGPAKISKLRKEAADMGLDPNIWFRNVEVVAAKRIGRETVNYVSNIFKYYLAYRLIVDKEELKEKIEKQ